MRHRNRSVAKANYQGLPINALTVVGQLQWFTTNEPMVSSRRAVTAAAIASSPAVCRLRRRWLREDIRPRLVARVRSRHIQSAIRTSSVAEWLAYVDLAIVTDTVVCVLLSVRLRIRS